MTAGLPRVETGMIEVETFRTAMRRLTGAVCVITTRGVDGVRNGLTATAVSSVTISPPTLLCCINKSASAFSAVRTSLRFAVNVLGAPDHGIASRFAGGESGEARFMAGAWMTLKTGTPVLESALVAFDCRVSDITEIGSHGIFFGEVQAVYQRETAVSPLLYLQGSFGTFAELS